MKRSSFILKYQKYHPINWSSNISIRGRSLRIDVGWIDFLFQFSQWSTHASGLKVIIHFRFLHILFNIFSYPEMTCLLSQINHNIQQMIILSNLQLIQLYQTKIKKIKINHVKMMNGVNLGIVGVIVWVLSFYQLLLQGEK